MIRPSRLLLYICCPLIIESSVIPFITFNQTKNAVKIPYYHHIFDCVDTFILICRTHYCRKKSRILTAVELFQKRSHLLRGSLLTLQKCYCQKKCVKELIKMPLLHDVPRLNNVNISYYNSANICLAVFLSVFLSFCVSVCNLICTKTVRTVRFKLGQCVAPNPTMCSII